MSPGQNQPQFGPRKYVTDDDQHDDHDHVQRPERAGRPAALGEPAPDAAVVAINVRNRHQADHDQAGNAQPAPEGVIGDQFLQAQKVPGRFGRVRRLLRIGFQLQRRRRPDGQGQNDGEAGRKQGRLPDQQVRPGRNHVVRPPVHAR